MIAPARRVATRVLERVARDDAWAAPTLDAELRRSGCSRADAALATQIVYGTLRVRPDLETSLKQHARRPVRVDDWTRAALLGAAYQLLYLDKVPAHAIVHDAVELVREKRGPRVAGFVNAVLRKLAAQRSGPAKTTSSMVVPPWLGKALEASIGIERAETLLRLAAELPSMDLRVRSDFDREKVEESILAAHPEAAVWATSLSPLGLRVSGAGDPRKLPGYAQGAFAVQEEGAQLIGLLVGAQRGERVLDACAGRGGKTAQLAEAVGEGGSVIATDLHEHRLEQIETELARLRLSGAHVQTACVDWTVGSGAVHGEFDRVLIDAPCTGLGTLRRRPEILPRSNIADAAQMGEVQRRILRRAAGRVRRGGSLLYAVCSPLREEGSEVVAGVDLEGFELQRGRPSSLKSLEFDSDGRLLLGPWWPGAGSWADAYQIFMWVNVG
jgi:16S rRNA (cytosine967-C5)-methyltransferase